MRVMLPAAGVGTRLRPLTQTLPKPLVPVGGRPLIARTLEQLHHVGVEDVVCVTGHLADVLEAALLACRPRPKLRFVRSRDHATTNSIVSLALTRRFWGGDFCVIDADVCFTDELLVRLLAAGGDALAIDTSKAPAEMDMAAELRNGRVIWLDKGLAPERSGGEFFGLSRWTPVGAGELGRSIDRLLARGRADVWYEFAIREAADKVPLAVVPARAEEWAEVDCAADLERAESLVRRAPPHHPWRGR